MSKANYFCLGAQAVGADLGADRALLVKIKNLDAVVAAQGGALGKLVASAAPGFVSDQAFAQTRQQLIDGFKQKGVDADVQIISTPISGEPPPKSDFGMGAVVGAVGVGLVVGVWKLIGWIAAY